MARTTPGKRFGGSERLAGTRLVASRQAPWGDGEAPARAVTAVVCTHNGERFLADQLQSILDQTSPVAEVVISDDASRDRTVQIATSILEDSGLPYRIYSRPAPLRVAANFHFAINRVRTEFAALADQDDRWHVRKIEQLLHVFKERPALELVHSDARVIDDLGQPLGGTIFGTLEISDREWQDYASFEPLTELIRRNIVTGATVMLRPQLARRAGLAPAPWIHDEWLAIAAAIAGRIAVVRDPLIDYRLHGGNLVGRGRLTLRQKVERATSKGYRAQVNRVARAEALLDRAASLGASEEQRALIGRKVSHERARLTLPESRMRRWPTVLRWGLKRRYRTYSRGAIDIVRDLFQSQADRTDTGALSIIPPALRRERLDAKPEHLLAPDDLD